MRRPRRQESALSDLFFDPVQACRGPFASRGLIWLIDIRVRVTCGPSSGAHQCQQVLRLSVDGVVHLSASDLLGHLNCHYLTKLDLAVARRELDKPSRWDPVLEVLVERGALHEQSSRAKRKLGDVLHELGEPSPTRLIHDHENGNLDAICRDRLVG
jgi:hypothetical protein